jgi:hypothetical protein
LNLRQNSTYKKNCTYEGLSSYISKVYSEFVRCWIDFGSGVGEFSNAFEISSYALDWSWSKYLIISKWKENNYFMFL